MTVANLGQIIKARRERMKINQENLAACAGISTKLLSDIECGRANPTFETMDLVAAALGVELEELLQPEIEFGAQEYGIATKKGSDLSATVDDTVKSLLDDGWLDEEIEAWGLL